MKKLIIIIALSQIMLFVNLAFADNLIIKPLSITAIDADGYPWPWCYVGDTGKGIAYYEAKGTGYYEIYIYIINSQGTVVSSETLGPYYNNTSYHEPYYAYAWATCQIKGVYTLRVEFKTLWDNKIKVLNTKVRVK